MDALNTTQSIPPQNIQAPLKQKNPRAVYFGVGIFLVLIALGLAGYSYLNKDSDIIPTNKSWQVYRNTNLGYKLEYPKEFKLTVVKNRLTLNGIQNMGDYDKIYSMTRLIQDNLTKKNPPTFNASVLDTQKTFPKATKKQIGANTELSVLYPCAPSTDGINPGQSLSSSKCAEYYTLIPYRNTALIYRSIIFTSKQAKLYYDYHQKIAASIKPL